MKPARLDASISRNTGLPAESQRLAPSLRERLAALYDNADLFVLASRFEGYGMAYAEALSHGLPVIGTTAGAIPDTVPQAAGLLVTPGDAAALARALRRVIADAELRRRLSEAALAAARTLPTWQQSGSDLCRRAGQARMSGFSAEWLALRESHDLRARNPIVLDAVAARFKSHDAISVVDLACGAGSTVRALSSHLPARQHWDLVDNDQRLLDFGV